MAWLDTHVILLIGELLGVALVVHILLQKRNPQVTMAWLMAILFLPFLGVPLYLMLGGRKVRRTTAKKTKLDLTPVEFYEKETMGPVRRLLIAYGLPAPHGQNHVEMLNSGEAVYDRLIRLIDEARTSIHMAMYVFTRDAVARQIRDRLAHKASQGLQVRLLVDGVGSLHTHHHFFRSLTQAGGRVEYFIPLLHRPFRGRTNLRNHRKIILVDGTTLLTGGMNIGKEYMGPVPDPKRWRDLSFILRGAAVRHYVEVFCADWAFASGEEIMPVTHTLTGQTSGDALVQVVPSGPDVSSDGLYDAIVSLAYTAQKRLWIVTPYFIPDQALSHALVIAARRGVDVRVVVPERSNHVLADLVRGRYLRDLQQAGAKILLYTPRMLHAKLMLMDDHVAMIGSANMDVRSLFLDYEIAAFIYDRHCVRALEDWIVETMCDCREGAKPVSFIRELVEGATQIIAPVI